MYVPADKDDSCDATVRENHQENDGLKSFPDSGVMETTYLKEIVCTQSLLPISNVNRFGHYC